MKEFTTEQLERFSRHILLQDVTVLDKRGFFDELRARLKSGKAADPRGGDILVFIHGYNVGFDLEMLRSEFRRLRQPPIDLSKKLVVDRDRACDTALSSALGLL